MENNKNSVPYEIRHLFDQKLEEYFCRIFTPAAVKERILNYMDTLARLSKMGASAVGLGTRRCILLLGNPGNGKTSLAIGAPNEWARTRKQEALLVTVNGHALASGERGASQKNVGKLFQALGETASVGLPVFAVVDEAETIGTHRGRIDPTTNPQDSIFAVNAWLQEMDRAARERPNLIFIFTTNLFGNLDPAIAQRMDFAVLVPPPDCLNRLTILQDALKEVQGISAIAPLPASNGQPMALPRPWAQLLKRTEGFSARQLRKLIVGALSFVREPDRLGLKHLLQTVEEERRQEEFHARNGGMCVHSFEGKAVSK